MPAAVRIGDSVSCGDVMDEGSGNTFAEGLPMSREGIDLTASHCFNPTPVASASPDVFTNTIPADRLGDPIVPHTCGDSTHGGNMSTGASHVFINSNSGAGAIIDNNIPFVTLGIIPPNVNPSPAPDISTVDVHVYENNDIPEEINAPPSGISQFIMEETQDDLIPPPEDTPPIQDCSTVDALDTNFNWSTEPGATTFANFANAFALSPNFTVLDMCHCAVGQYDFSSSVTQNSGLSQKEILANMCHHAKIILEPMLAAHGAFTITSGFRNKSGSSQHNKGQASDIQFLNIHGLSNTSEQYYALAQNIKDNINFDQMILEWFGRNPWIHISSNPSGHRHNVLTQISSSSYTPGLKLLKRR